MKRSKMEHNIKEWLLTNGGTQTVDIPELLDFLESQGMQPPQREVKGGHLVPAEDGQEAMLTYSIVVNEWEPE